MVFEKREISLAVLGTIGDIEGLVEDICLKTKHEDSIIMPNENVRKNGLKFVPPGVGIDTR